jgi:outer membrane protein OmpA-like peptidoglycan-associated protein
MKNLLIIACLLTFNLVLAGNLGGTIYNENSNSPLDDCLVTLSQNGKILSSTRSDFEGNFVLSFKKNKKYTLEITKAGYKTESVDVFIDDDFIKKNPHIPVYLKALDLKPKFDKVQDGLLKPVPNPDIMEDIGSLDNLPEGYKIIEAKPLKLEDKEQSQFNVNMSDPVEKTNVNVEVLKREFNKEDLEESIHSEEDKFPSSYYAEGNIYYGSGRALLTESVREVLDDIAKKLNESPLTTLKLVAYADGEKEALIGYYIGKLRAEEITKYLIAKSVDFSKLKISVIGNTSLQNGCYKGQDCSEYEHQQNRRVDIYLLE